MRVTAAHLRAFLARERWEQVGADGLGESWANPGAADAPAIMVPTNPEDSSYGVLLDVAMTRLAAFTGVVRDQLASRILVAVTDALEVRVIDPLTAEGHIQLERGVQLANTLKTVVVNGARLQFAGGRLAYSGSMSKAANDVMGRLEMAAPSVGSFRLTVVGPAEAQLAIEMPDESPRPPDPVHDTLVSAMGALEVARKTTEEPIPTEPEALEDAVSRGVSSNLIKAVRVLDTQSPALRVEFRARWATPDPRAVESVELQSQHFAALPALERVLKYYEPRRFHLSGWIKEVIAAEFAVAQQLIGTVVVEMRIENRPRLIRVEVPGETLQQAGASVGQRFLEADGRLERIGRFWYLADPTDLRITEAAHGSSDDT